MLIETLTQAATWLREKMGPDMGTWSWGQLHQLRFEPAIAALADPALKAQLSVGPLALGGSAASPAVAGYRAGDFAVNLSASVRMVLDVGDWDRSQIINAPGQSADPTSPRYRDLVDPWAAGHYVPLQYSKSAVDRHAETVLTLVPGRGSDVSAR